MEAPLPPIHRRKCLVGLFLTKAQILPQCYDWHKCKCDVPVLQRRVGSGDFYMMGQVLADHWVLSHEGCIDHFRLQCTNPRQPIMAHTKDCFWSEAILPLERRVSSILLREIGRMPWKMFLLNPDVQPED